MDLEGITDGERQILYDFTHMCNLKKHGLILDHFLNFSSSLLVLLLVSPLVVWWFSLVVCLCPFLSCFCVSIVGFWLVVIMGFIYLNLYLLVWNWWSFKFKHILKSTFFPPFPYVLCLWCHILYLHAYPFTVYYNYSLFYNFLVF